MTSNRDLMSRAWRDLRADLITVRPYLNESYPDDDRWTPWTRFVGRGVDRMDEAVKASKAELARLTQALSEIAGREWRDEGGRIAAAIARDGLNSTGRFDPRLRDHATEPTRVPIEDIRPGDVLDIRYVSPQFGHETVRRTVVSVGNEIILRDEAEGREYEWRHPEQSLSVKRVPPDIDLTA